MPNKIAIDWDESELRFVAANVAGNRVSVTDAAVIPIDDESVTETLRKLVRDRGLEKSDALVAIGRGKSRIKRTSTTARSRG